MIGIGAVGLGGFYAYSRRSFSGDVGWRRDFAFNQAGVFKYHLRLKQSQSAGEMLGGSTDLDCTLNAAVSEPGLSAVFFLSDCGTLQLEGNGLSPDSAGSRESIENHRVLATFSREGSLRGLRSSDASPGLGASLIRLVLLEAQPALPLDGVSTGSAKDANSGNANGIAALLPSKWQRTVHYTSGTYLATLGAEHGKPGLIRRQSLIPVKLPGSGLRAEALAKAFHEETQNCEVQVSEVAGWDRVDCAHRFTVKAADGADLFKSEISLKLERDTATGAAPATRDERPLLAQFPAEVPTDPFTLSDKVRKKLLAQRVGNLTPAALENHIKSATAGGTFGSWLPQAVALIEQDPAMVGRLQSLFRETSSFEERSLILDLMAGATGSSVQAGLVSVLSEAIGDSRFTPAAREQWYQRLAMLEDPDGTTLRFGFEKAGNLAPQGEDPVSRAEWVSLGALAGKADPADPLRDKAVEKISTALTHAQGNFGIEAMVMAAGNTRDAALVDPIREIALSSKEPGIRGTAAVALGSLPGDRAEAALWQLSNDTSDKVAAAALRSLRGRDETSVLSGWDRFAAAANSPDALVRVEALNLWESHPDHVGRAEVKALKQMVENPLEEATTRTRARALLERTGGEQ